MNGDGLVNDWVGGEMFFASRKGNLNSQLIKIIINFDVPLLRYQFVSIAPR